MGPFRAGYDCPVVAIVDEATRPRAPWLRGVGPVSLLVAFAGATGCYVVRYAGWAGDPTWLHVLRAGFEAALVGGLADWFAVTALFRHPLGIPIPHTAIIPKRREKLIDGIVSIVEDDWLSPEVIGARVTRFAPSDALLTWLRDRDKVKVMDAPLRGMLRGLAHILTQREVVEGLDAVLRRQLERYPIDEHAGRWLGRITTSESATTAFETMALSLAQVAHRPSTARKMHEWLEHSAAKMEAEGRRFLPLVLRSQIVRGKVVEAACNYAASELSHAAYEPDHPLRRFTFDAVLRFAVRLANGEPEALGSVEGLRATLLENLSDEPITAESLAELQRQVIEELDRPDSKLLDTGLEKLRTLLVRTFESPANRDAFEGWVRAAAIHLVERNHHQIGITIRESLEALDTETLVAQVEERLGPDLQFIRLNGAIVGGLIGVLLAVVRLVLG